MIAVSDLWKAKQKEFIAPEGFIEISYFVSEDGLQEEAVPSSTSETVFSDIGNITDAVNDYPKEKWATTELNLWSLDGSMNVLPDNAPYENIGYVSSSLESGNAKLTLNELHTQPIQGVTITWSSEYGEYATDFTVTAYNGNAAVVTKAVTENNSVTSVVEMDIADYDSVVIAVTGWSNPQHRVRIEKVFLGVNIVYDKGDLMKFKHEQLASAVSGELPKNSIEFSLKNENGQWNPNNPTGNEKYLSERQQIKVRYGFDIDGTVEWIKAGTFYLSEWRTPSNGLEATFVARDLLVYMLDDIYAGTFSGTLYEIASAAVAQADLPSGAVVRLSERLKNYSAEFEGDYTLAEVLQMCANAACCVIYQNRDGELIVEYSNTPMGDYRIRGEAEYSYPEFELLKPLKNIEVTYGAEYEKYSHTVGVVGEKQTISNPFIATETQAEMVAQWVENTLKFRKSINGEYRADPRLDVFDRIAVESKFGVNNAVSITNITYTFAGAFKGSYSGIITEFTPVPAAYCGEIYFGEV